MSQGVEDWIDPPCPEGLLIPSVSSPLAPAAAWVRIQGLSWTLTEVVCMVSMPGESQGWGSLVGCHLWGRTESDTTEVT